MPLSRIPQRVSNALASVAGSFACPQGQHFRVFCWLLVTLIVSEGGARLKALTCLMPRSLAYWTVLRMRRSGYWDAAFLVEELSVAVLATLAPPADGVLHLTGDSTITARTGAHHPLARKTRTNEYASYVFGQALVLVIAQWGRYRVPVRAAVVEPPIKGHQNLLFRQLLKDFVPPAWVKRVIVEADAAFAAKATLTSLTDRGWAYVFGLARTWKLTDGTHVRDLARPYHARLLSTVCCPQTRRSPEMLLGLSSHGPRAPSGACPDSPVQTAAQRRAATDQTARDQSPRGHHRHDSQSLPAAVGCGSYLQRTQERAALGAEAGDERASARRARVAVARPGLPTLAALVRPGVRRRARCLDLAAQTALYEGGLSRTVRPV
jgi:hypothetical protein